MQRNDGGCSNERGHLAPPTPLLLRGPQVGSLIQRRLSRNNGTLSLITLNLPMATFFPDDHTAHCTNGPQAEVGQQEASCTFYIAHFVIFSQVSK